MVVDFGLYRTANEQGACPLGLPQIPYRHLNIVWSFIYPGAGCRYESAFVVLDFSRQFNSEWHCIEESIFFTFSSVFILVRNYLANSHVKSGELYMGWEKSNISEVLTMT